MVSRLGEVLWWASCAIAIAIAVGSFIPEIATMLYASFRGDIVMVRQHATVVLLNLSAIMGIIAFGRAILYVFSNR